MANEKEPCVGHAMHRFHLACIGDWFACHPTHPICPLGGEPVLNASKFIPLSEQKCVLDYAFHGCEADIQERLALGGLTEKVRSDAIILAIVSPFALDQTAKKIVGLLLSDGSILDGTRERARELAASCRSPDIVALLEKNH